MSIIYYCFNDFEWPFLRLKSFKLVTMKKEIMLSKRRFFTAFLFDQLWRIYRQIFCVFKPIKHLTQNQKSEMFQKEKKEVKKW